MKKLLTLLAVPLLAACSLFGPSEYEPTDMSGQNNQRYTDYTASLQEEMKGKKYAITFHAEWCPSCVKLDKEIKENIASLPADALILKANYDLEKDLGEMHGVKSQHTVVLFDEKGNTETIQGYTLENLQEFFMTDEMAKDEMMNDEAEMSAWYGDYDAEMAEKFSGKKYALFFHANWCPSCVKLDKEITKHLESLSESTVLFKVDYDTQKDLGEMYGVKSQHTAVLISADGSHESVQGFTMADIENFFQ